MSGDPCARCEELLQDFLDRTLTNEEWREAEDHTAQRVNQQELNEIIERESEEAVDVAANDPTHAVSITAPRITFAGSTRLAGRTHRYPRNPRRQIAPRPCLSRRTEC